MKKLAYSILLSLPFLFTACGDSPESEGGENNGETKDSVEVDLSNMSPFEMDEFGLGIMMYLPQETSEVGSSIQPKVTHEDGDFRWMIQVGPKFQMIIQEEGKDENLVAHEKENLANMPFFKIEYIIDEPALIMYKRELANEQGGKVTYHVFGEKKIGEINHVFKSGPDGGLKPIIKNMTNTIRSIEVMANVN